MTRLILVDIDIPFSIMKEFGLFEILEEKIDFCMKKFNVSVELINITQSQCGNTHVHIVVDRDLDPITVLRLKFCIGEDHKRYIHSVRRYKKTGKILDFFWMKKIKDCD